jgi:hypothetical protein
MAPRRASAQVFPENNELFFPWITQPEVKSQIRSIDRVPRRKRRPAPRLSSKSKTGGDTVKQRIATSAARTRHFELHEHVLESTAHTIQDPFLADGVTRGGARSTPHRLSSALRICFVVWIAAVAGVIAGCGGGSGKNVQNQTTTTTYKIGGTTSGLTGSGLVLQDNGGDNLTVTASIT